MNIWTHPNLKWSLFVCQIHLAKRQKENRPVNARRSRARHGRPRTDFVFAAGAAADRRRDSQRLSSSKDGWHREAWGH